MELKNNSLMISIHLKIIKNENSICFMKCMVEVDENFSIQLLKFGQLQCYADLRSIPVYFNNGRKGKQFNDVL